jgi:HEAT repeat protein
MNIIISLILSAATAEPVINSWAEIVSPPEVTDPYWQSQRQVLLEECSYDIAYCQEVYTSLPRATRNNEIYRFSNPELAQAQLIPVHLARFYDPKTPDYVRLALLDILRRTDGPWEDGLYDAVSDQSPAIRSAIAGICKYASSEFSQSTLSILASDSNIEVQASALRGIGHQDSIEYQSLLEKALQHDSGLIRYSAIRSIGYTSTPVALNKMTPLLSDIDPMVRLHALRAISRVYPDIAGKLPQLETLREDRDPKVKREAYRLSN